ncbi:hypothetical protein [Phaeobacter sp. 22II1-1F12B]|uniref:hypothetical protein n=1 Tax=Phaeobacter sp. 22II1-1F12B TaxID=1317111 RepID=UPI000B52536E|nr:hypothetical protein [Phaeobacter sp. 22II1-1F12B]OWU66675.1 hypothetical protein ATO1_26010 [Phaeobacter sp. 22II1-1F12B]
MSIGIPFVAGVLNENPATKGMAVATSAQQVIGKCPLDIWIVQERSGDYPPAYEKDVGGSAFRAHLKMNNSEPEKAAR